MHSDWLKTGEAALTQASFPLFGGKAKKESGTIKYGEINALCQYAFFRIPS